MDVFEVSQNDLSYVLQGFPGDWRYVLVRPQAYRWTESDLIDVLIDLLQVRSLYVWKFTRIITKDDKAFGQLAQSLGKTTEEVWKPFSKWPAIEKRVRDRVKQSVAKRSYVYGVADLKLREDSGIISELVSLLNSSEFAETGLIEFRTASSPNGLAGNIDEVHQLFRLLIASRTKAYLSQEEWDRDLQPKEDALLKVMHGFVRNRIVMAIPLMNADVEISLLVVCSNDYFESLQREERPIESLSPEAPLSYTTNREWLENPC
jgi:hypothetical protein